MTTSNKPRSIYVEAPASWNTRYVTPTGFVCQLTLRSGTGPDLLEKAETTLSLLLEMGYSPGDNNNHHKDTRLCPIHLCEMRRREKDGQYWYSHRLEDGSWCWGRQSGEGGSHEQ